MMSLEEIIFNHLKDFENEYGNYFYSRYDEKSNTDYDFDEELENILDFLKERKDIKDYITEYIEGFDSPGYTNEIVSIAILTKEDRLKLITLKKESY